MITTSTTNPISPKPTRNPDFFFFGPAGNGCHLPPGDIVGGGESTSAGPDGLPSRTAPASTGNAIGTAERDASATNEVSQEGHCTV